ncbi:hypothetical protein IE077_000700, partial [Cardiosporidium cionae]
MADKLSISALPISSTDPLLANFTNSSYWESGSISFHFVSPQYPTKSAWEDMYTYQQVYGSIAIHCPEDDIVDSRENPASREEIDGNVKKFTVVESSSTAEVIAAQRLLEDYEEFSQVFLSSYPHLLNQKCFCFRSVDMDVIPKQESKTFMFFDGEDESNSWWLHLQFAMKDFAALLIRHLVGLQQQPNDLYKPPITTFDVERDQGNPSERSHSNLHGRLTKLKADILVLGGNSLDAISAYSAAIEAARLANDWEWKAVSLEGQAAAVLQFILQEDESYVAGTQTANALPSQIEALLRNAPARSSSLFSTSQINEQSNKQGVGVGVSTNAATAFLFSYENQKQALLELIVSKLRECLGIFSQIRGAGELYVYCALRYCKYLLKYFGESICRNALPELLDVIRELELKEQIKFYYYLAGVYGGIGSFRKFAYHLYQASILYEEAKLWESSHYLALLVSPWYHLEFLEPPPCSMLHPAFYPVENGEFYSLFVNWIESVNPNRLSAISPSISNDEVYSNNDLSYLENKFVYSNLNFIKSFRMLYHALCGKWSILPLRWIEIASQISNTAKLNLRGMFERSSSSSLKFLVGHARKNQYCTTPSPIRWATLQQTILDLLRRSSMQMNDYVKIAWYSLASLLILHRLMDVRTQTALVKEFKGACEQLENMIFLPINLTIYPQKKLNGKADTAAICTVDSNTENIHYTHLGGICHNSCPMIPLVWSLSVATQADRNNQYSLHRIHHAARIDDKSNEVNPKSTTGRGDGVWMYNPFKRQETREVEVKPAMLWGKEETYGVFVEFFNPLNVDIELRDVSLMSSGAEVEMQPLNFLLPPARATTIRLNATPKAEGKIYFTGIILTWYKFRSCQLFLHDSSALLSLVNLQIPSSDKLSDDLITTMLRHSSVLCVEVTSHVPLASIGMEILKEGAEQWNVSCSTSTFESSHVGAANISSLTGDTTGCVETSSSFAATSLLNPLFAGEELMRALSVYNCSKYEIGYFDVRLCRGDTKEQIQDLTLQAHISVLMDEESVKAHFTNDMIAYNGISAIRSAGFCLKPYHKINIPVKIFAALDLPSLLFQVHYGTSRDATSFREVFIPFPFSICQGIGLKEPKINVFPIIDFNFVAVFQLLKDCGHFSHRFLTELSRFSIDNDTALTSFQFWVSPSKKEMREQLVEYFSKGNYSGGLVHQCDHSDCLACLDLMNGTSVPITCMMKGNPSSQCVVPASNGRYRWAFTHPRQPFDEGAGNKECKALLSQYYSFSWKTPSGQKGSFKLLMGTPSESESLLGVSSIRNVALPRINFSVNLLLDGINLNSFYPPLTGLNKAINSNLQYKVPLHSAVMMRVSVKSTIGEMLGPYTVFIVPFSYNSLTIPEHVAFAGSFEHFVDYSSISPQNGTGNCNSLTEDASVQKIR